jgi:hypothetical protein
MNEGEANCRPGSDEQRCRSQERVHAEANYDMQHKAYGSGDR